MERSIRTATGLRRSGQLERALAALAPEALATQAGAQLAVGVVRDAEQRMVSARVAADARGATTSPEYLQARQLQSRAEAARARPNEAVVAVRAFLEAAGAFARAEARPMPPAPTTVAAATTTIAPPPPATTTVPPATTTTPVRPPPTARAEPLILARLDAFERAYESRSVAAVEAVWPGMPDVWRQTLQRSFRQYSSVEWTYNSRTVTVTGDTATVLTDVAVTSEAGGRSLTTPRRYQFVLRAQGGSWVVTDVRLR